MAKPLIGYIRVSTQKQGRSGLGLEAQQAAIRQYAATRGEVVAVYTEVETGKRNDRPRLSEALAHARRIRATLVIAKLDRLSRKVHFISGLMESGVPFACADRPDAEPFELHIWASVAEEEARKISQRTKEALAAYKDRGGLLGAARPNGHRFTRDESLKGARRGGEVAKQVIRRNAIAAYADIGPKVVELRRAGWTQQQIADELNRLGYTTRNGVPWGQVQILRVLQRFANHCSDGVCG